MSIDKNKIQEVAKKLYDSTNPHIVHIGEKPDGIVMYFVGKKPTKKEKEIKEIDGVPIEVKYIGKIVIQ